MIEFDHSKWKAAVRTFGAKAWHEIQLIPWRLRLVWSRCQDLLYTIIRLLEHPARALMRFWNTARPSWPIALAAAVASWLATQTGQGWVVLTSVAADGGVLFKSAMLVLITSLAQNLIALDLMSRYFPFTANGLAGVLGQLFTAGFIAILTPLALFVFYFGEAYRAQLISTDIVGEGGVFCAAAVFGATTAFLCVAFFVIARKFVHIWGSPLSPIMVLDPVLRRARDFVWAGAIAATIWLSFFDDAPAQAGPIGVLVIGATIWGVAIAFLVSLIVQRGGAITVGVLVASVLLALSLNRDHHLVRTIEAPQSEITSAETYASQWLAARRVDADGRDDTPIPAYVIIAEGGGMRAALHTAALLAKLDADPAAHFYDNIYLMSGTSGGALGLAAFAAMKRDGATPDEVDGFLRTDHLSPLIARLFLADAPAELAPLPRIPDRAAAFERSLERGWRRIMIDGDAFALPFASVLPPARPRASDGPEIAPAMLFQTVVANTGELEMVGAITFGDGARRTGAPVNVLSHLSENETLSLSAAVDLSARFPLVSPGGIIETRSPAHERRVYVDGGYFDNSSAASALPAVRQLMRQAAEGCQANQRGACYSDRLRVIVIHIFTRTLTSNETEAVQPESPIDELSIPLRAFTLARRVSGYGPAEALCRAVANEVAVNSENERHYATDSCALVRELYNDRPHEDLKPSSVAVAPRCAAADMARRQAGWMTPGQASAVAGAAAQDDVICALTGRRLPWISAALDAAERPGDRGFAPLGWYLSGDGDGDRITEQARTRAEVVARALCVLRTPADQSVEQCG